MAATIIELIHEGVPLEFNVSDGDEFTKGTIMKLTGTREVEKSAENGDVFAGVLAMDKEKDDGSTTVSCYTKGVFEFQAASEESGSAGDLVKIAGENEVQTTTDVKLAFGRALTDFSGGEKVEVILL